MEQLESQIEILVENVRQLGIIVSDFQPQTGQPVLNQKINQVVSSLKDIDRLKDSIENVQLPREVCEYIDSGKNPQFYTKDYMERALNKNEEVKGKIEYYKKFKKLLFDELTTIFPPEMEHYHQMRTKKQDL